MSYPLIRFARQQSSKILGGKLPVPRSLLSATLATRSDVALGLLSSPTASPISAATTQYHPSRAAAIVPPHWNASRHFFSSEATSTTTDSTTTSTTTTSTSTTLTNDDTAAAAAAEATHEFKAETRQLLDIVTNSLYADKEVFLRELISNASDALEKLRHVQTTNSHAVIDPDLPLEIRIETDEVNGTLTISDTGIGMTKEEMVSNLGTIARSGSKAWMKEMERKAKEGEHLDATRGIIGKFGVGFYSAFMVGQTVEVRSKSALLPTPPLEGAASADDATATADHDVPKSWTSDGSGVYRISNLDNNVRQPRGVSVVIKLKEKDLEYCDESRVEEIITRYSNFVNFPIYLNGNLVNTISAIWTKDPKEVDDDTYAQFYQFIANATDYPLDTLHFRAEAPLDVKALLFVPSFHSEKYGMGRMDPGVSLYSRKVLIEHKSPDILPDWLRFLKGVVDSEDLPLAISREKAQDSNLIGKLRKALTRKFVSHIANMAKKDRDTYLHEFHKEYSFFLKEGICQDYEFQESLSKLLYYETSKSADFQVSSLEEYIARSRPEQKDIYYLNAPSRELAVQSPYMEAFDKAGIEVIFVFTAIDEFVMSNLKTFQGRNLVNVEKGGIDLSDFLPDPITKPSEKEGDDDKSSATNKTGGLTATQAEDFCKWFADTLGTEKVSRCKTTNRLTSSPAVVVDNESGAMRRIMRMVESDSLATPPLQEQQVEINPSHPIIVGLYDLREREPALAKVLAEQIYDNCIVAAGLMDDSRAMLPRLNDIMLCVVQGAMTTAAPTSTNSTTEDSASSSETDRAETSLSLDESNATVAASPESEETMKSAQQDTPKPSQSS